MTQLRWGNPGHVPCAMRTCCGCYWWGLNLVVLRWHQATSSSCRRWGLNHGLGRCHQASTRGANGDQLEVFSATNEVSKASLCVLGIVMLQM